MVEGNAPNESDPSAYRRLYRSLHQRVLGGVCGGLAEYFNIDVVVVRVLWILFILVGGTGILAYIICWIMIPTQTDPAIPAPGRRSGGMVFGVILVALGVLLLFGWSGWHYRCFPFWFDGFPFPWLLMVLGLGLLIGWVLARGHARSVPPPTPGAAPEGETTGAEQKTSDFGPLPSARLYRSRDFRVIAGICGGLGQYFRLDPTIMRILWVLFGFASLGTAIIIYIILIFVVPEEPVS